MTMCRRHLRTRSHAMGDWRLAWPLALALALHGTPASAGLVEATQVHPRLTEGVPRASDVVFSTRFKRDDAPTVARAFGATRIEWGYSTEPAFVDVLRQVAPWIGCTLNANPKLPNDDGYVRDFDGKVLAAPWMTGWGVYWVSSAHPDTQAAHAEALRRCIAVGARSVQFDDPQLQMFAAVQQGGDFNPAMVAGFPGWLAGRPDRAAVRAAGLDGFKGDYRAWLAETQGVKDAADYRRRLRQLPSTSLWLAYTRSEVLAHHRRLRQMAALPDGRRMAWSMNLGGLTEPLASNPFSFLAPAADYAIGETQIKDWTLQVMQAATTRALGLGFVPSLKPQSRGENRTAIAYLHALGGNVVVPWDVYDGNDEQGKPRRFFGQPADFGDLYAFVRSHARLLDGLELAPAVGVLVPVDRGQVSVLRGLGQRMVGRQVPFAYVPVGGEAGYTVDAARLRGLQLLVTTNPDADYPAAALEALRASGVPRVPLPELRDDRLDALRPYLLAPGAERVRVVPRADPRNGNRLVLHLVDTARGEQTGADAGCRRRMGIKREAIGGLRVVRIAWADLEGQGGATPEDESAGQVFFTIPRCSLWTVVELGLDR